MKIVISDEYKAVCDTDILGFIGETNAGTITIEQPVVEGATKKAAQADGLQNVSLTRCRKISRWDKRDKE